VPPHPRPPPPATPQRRSTNRDQSCAEHPGHHDGPNQPHRTPNRPSDHTRTWRPIP
jgi:hypothetical protein